MRKYIYVLASVMLFSSCESKIVLSKNENPSAEKEVINTVLDAWHKNAAEADFDRYFEAMTSESIFIGTDASENWNNEQFKDFSKPYFDKGKAWSFTPIERNVYVNSEGKIAWFDELLKTHMGICRGSGVLIKTEHTWKIEHYVLSITIANDNIEEVTSLNKVRDSLFLSKQNK